MRVQGRPLNLIVSWKKNDPPANASPSFHTAWPSLSDLVTRTWKSWSAWCGNWLTIAVWLHSGCHCNFSIFVTSRKNSCLPDFHIIIKNIEVQKKQRRALLGKSYRMSALFPKHYLAQVPPMKILMNHLQKPQAQVCQVRLQSQRNQCHSGRPTTFSVRSVVAKFLGGIFLMNMSPLMAPWRQLCLKRHRQ